ncbi:AraC family transcriptional regulator [Sphingosinicellaceae bacterium]|nr:AraC family transcriptional regulator [Sphingosinicellaceae bacterium]
MFDWPLASIPRISVAGRFPLADRGYETRYLGATHALHCHDYTGRVRLTGGKRQIARGDVTISPAGDASAYDLDAPGAHWCIHFTTAARGETVSMPLHITGRQDTREKMAHIAALYARGGSTAATLAGLALQTLLLELTDDKPLARPGVAERAAALIDQRFTEPLSAADVAAAAGCGQAHLARAFRSRYSTTVPHRLLLRRVEHARYLLESTDLPVWRIAERAGIPDPQHFNKTVRRVLGSSPSGIRAAAHLLPVDPDR